jgi:hypothetical protein
MTNLQLAQTQLSALGYAPTDAIYFRAIGPDSARKLDARKLEGTIEQRFNELQSLNSKGYGIYFVVNNGGHADADVTHGYAIFYEHDNLPKDIQIDLWQTLGLPEPTIQVDTGGKSIHSYWVFDHPMPIADWKILQTDLLNSADADRTIKNASRVMRLAGFTHQKSGGESVITTIGGKRYSFEELRSVVKVKEVAPKSAPKPRTGGAVDDRTVPIQSCLSRNNRELLRNGVSEGGRNDAGAKLARDLIGVQSWFGSNGYRAECDARTLFEDFCGRCSPALDAREADQIWRSAEKSTDGPCLSEDKLEGCVEGHFKRQQSKNSTGQTGDRRPVLSAIEGGRTGPKGSLGLRAAVLESIALGLTGSEKTERVGELATQYKATTTHVNRLWKEIVDEQEQADDSEGEAAIRLESELALTSRSLPDNVFPYQIAMHLPRQAELIGTTTEALVMTAFPVLASVVNAATGLRVKAGANPWIVRGIVWMALVAMSGDGKTPTIGVWMNALKRLQKSETADYEEKMLEYKRSKRDFDTAVKKGEEPEGEEPKEPVLRWTVVKKATLPGLAETQMGQPDRGCLIHKPELTALQNSFGMHSKGGASDDLEQFLDLRDGGDILTRNAGSTRRTDSTRFSLMGGIQPSKLLEQMGDRKDSQGFWGRFCIYNLPTVDPDDNETERDVINGERLADLLTAVILRINAFKPVIYELSSEAKERSKEYRRQLQDRVHGESREQMRNFIKKLKGYVHEFALLLHLLDAAVETGVEPDLEVSLETLERAITISEFCHAQRYIFEAQADAAAAKTQTKATLTTVQAEVLKRALSTKKAVSARDCRNFIHTCSKVDAESLRACFVSLEKMGHGKTIGSGNRLKFEAFLPIEEIPEETVYEYEFEEEILATA